MKNTIKNIVVKGQFVSVEAFKTSADCDRKLRKSSTLRGRLTAVQTYTNGRICDYEGLAEVKALRESGVEAKKPTWWGWTDFPYFAQHKTNGTEYFVLKTADVSTQYYLDGQPIKKADYASDFLASSDKESLVYMVKLADIVKIKSNGNVWQRTRLAM